MNLVDWSKLQLSASDCKLVGSAIDLLQSPQKIKQALELDGLFCLSGGGEVLSASYVALPLIMDVVDLHRPSIASRLLRAIGNICLRLPNEYLPYRLQERYDVKKSFAAFPLCSPATEDLFTHAYCEFCDGIAGGAIVPSQEDRYLLFTYLRMRANRLRKLLFADDWDLQTSCAYLLCWLGDSSVSGDLESILLTRSRFRFFQLANSILAYGISSFYSKRQMNILVLEKVFAGGFQTDIDECVVYRDYTLSQRKAILDTCVAIAFAHQERSDNIKSVLRRANDVNSMEEDEDELFCTPTETPIAEGDLSYYSSLIYKEIASSQ